MEDFLQPQPDSVDDYLYRDAVQRADMNLVRMSLAPDQRTLTFIFDTPTYLEKEAADKLKPFIRRALIYGLGRRKICAPAAAVNPSCPPFYFTLILSNPSPYTPITALCDTKA